MNEPLLLDLKSLTQPDIFSGVIKTAPQDPMPPALLIAAPSSAGHAPAIGAMRIGISSP
jgi:hypothetical protein